MVPFFGGKYFQGRSICLINILSFALISEKDSDLSLARKHG